MQNPILQLINANQANRNPNELLQRITAIKSFLSGKNSNILYTQLLNNNPQFRDFVKKAEGKSVEDIALEYDIDINLLKKIL